MKKVSIVGIVAALLFSMFVTGCSTLGFGSPGSNEEPNIKPVAAVKDDTKEVDENLAKQLIAQQRQSRENMRRLAEGQIKSFTADNVTKWEDKVSVKITANYSDNAQLVGFMDFIKKGNDWYLSTITRESLYPLPPASTEGISGSLLQMGKDIVVEQRDNQEIIKDLIDGKINRLEIDDVNASIDDTTLEVTVLYKDNTKVNGTMELTRQDGYWYLTKITKKS